VIRRGVETEQNPLAAIVCLNESSQEADLEDMIRHDKKYALVPGKPKCRLEAVKVAGPFLVHSHDFCSALKVCFKGASMFWSSHDDCASDTDLLKTLENEVNDCNFGSKLHEALGPLQAVWLQPGCLSCCDDDS
jgi:hypothetical protein